MSAIVLSYNNAQFVGETLDSIRAQNYESLELIVVDDGSTDDSIRRIRAWCAAHACALTLIEHPENQGLCRSLNHALRVAQGHFISAVGSDDRWHPEKLTRQLALFRQQGDRTGLIYSDADCMDEQGLRLPTRFIAEWRPEGRPPDDAVFQALQDGNFIPAPTTLVRRSCFDAVGLYDETLAYEDWDMWLRIAHAYRVSYSDYVSAEYRVVRHSLTRRLLKTGNPSAVETAARIARKWARQKTLAAADRRLWARRLTEAARELFRVRHPSAPYALLWAIRSGLPAERLPLARDLARSLWAKAHGRFTQLPS